MMEGYAFTWYKEITFLFESILLHVDFLFYNILQLITIGNQ